MLSRFTDDLNFIFKEDVEDEYFWNIEEVMDKIRCYLKHNNEREKMACAGQEVTSPGRKIIKTFERIKEEG